LTPQGRWAAPGRSAVKTVSGPTTKTIERRGGKGRQRKSSGGGLSLKAKDRVKKGGGADRQIRKVKRLKKSWKAPFPIQGSWDTRRGKTTRGGLRKERSSGKREWIPKRVGMEAGEKKEEFIRDPQGKDLKKKKGGAVKTIFPGDSAGDRVALVCEER